MQILGKQMTKHAIFKTDFSPLVDILPGKNKKFLNYSIIRPEEILQLLDRLDNNFDTLIMATVDTWFFHDAEPIILSHPVLKGKMVFLQTQEYTNKYLGNNCWRLSYPSLLMYNNRSLPADNTFKIKEKNLPYGFGSLNNRPALHRLLLGTELFNRGLLDNIVFTQNNTQKLALFPPPVCTPGKVDSRYWQDIDLLYNTPGFLEYEKLLPIKWQGEEIQNKWSIHHYAETNTYCNITTESVTEMIPYEKNINLPEVSEKSHKPFMSGQIPLFLAPQGHNAYFKNLGFELMEDLTPPGFDQFNTQNKIKAIADVVARGREWIEDFYFSHLREIKHNHYLIFSDKIDQLILSRIKNFIKNDT
jgi:hypothetical protein